MGIATLLGRSKGPTIGGIQIDVSVRETHRQSSEATDHAIELGADVQDHIRRLPDQVLLEGIVSNLTTNLIDFVELQRSGEDAQKRYQDLIDLVESADTFELVTGLRSYTDMVFLTFEVDRDQNTGEIVRFRAQMKQLRFATSEVVAVIANEDDTPKAASETDVGPKKPTPAPEEAAEGMKSSASRVFTKPNAAGLAEAVQSFGEFLGL